MKDKSSQLIAGLHSVRTALRHGADGVLELWVERRRKDRKISELLALAGRQGIRATLVERETLETLVPGANHQGVAARTRVPAALDEKGLERLLTEIEQPAFLLILDGVQDPHNLGACLRSADAAGVHAVIAPKDRSVGLTPVACKVASGAAESVPFVQVTNLVRTMKQLQQEQRVWLLGTSDDAQEQLYQTDLKGPVGVVMGAEEKGMRRLTREACDQLVSLPMAGVVESLNVSVATGICLFEVVRQRS